MRLGFIMSLIFAIIVTIFAIQNSTPVDVNFLFGSAKVSEAIVIFISAIAGAVIVTILSLIREFKLKRKIKQQAKTIKTLKEENENIKSKLYDINKLDDTQPIILNNINEDDNEEAAVSKIRE